MRKFLHRFRGETESDRLWSLRFVMATSAFSFGMGVTGIILGLRCSGYL